MKQEHNLEMLINQHHQLQLMGCLYIPIQSLVAVCVLLTIYFTHNILFRFEMNASSSDNQYNLIYNFKFRMNLANFIIYRRLLNEPP